MIKVMMMMMMMMMIFVAPQSSRTLSIHFFVGLPSQRCRPRALVLVSSHLETEPLLGGLDLAAAKMVF